ncbi:hypothetical protein CRE_07746 [Caenorhabditis remanei]|uniref:RING-type domain-containing protein n=1 Tax=Caenorhabditis remanei TaxID=31234 RepID=E3N6R1_CAERE|nr:hypothetical protein CRE_07746 [Caenorhabditis remanei]
MPRTKNVPARNPQSKSAKLKKLEKELEKVKADLIAEKQKGVKIKKKIKKLRSIQRRIQDEALQKKADFLLEIKQKKLIKKKIREEIRLSKFELKVLTDEGTQDEQLEKAKETKQKLEERHKRLTDALEKGLDVKPWKECPVCLQEFGEEGHNIPKVLDCGHTFCLSCTKKIAKPGYIKCPFDGVILIFKRKKDLEGHPKNYKCYAM